jgi:pimeloyl-ACP methyl ester carboxylesterase
MGAAAICFAAGRKPSADAVILESLYHDLDSAFASRMASTYPGYYRRLTRGIIWVTERRLRLHLHQIAPCDHIADLAPAPVLLLTGTRDAHAPPTEAQRLFDRCTSHRELWLVPGARHKDVFEVGGPAYERRVLAFLDRWLRIASPAEAG